jgi:hypothetical protein
MPLLRGPTVPALQRLYSLQLTPMITSMRSFALAAIVFFSIGLRAEEFIFESETLRYTLGSDGLNKSLVAKATGKQLLSRTNSPFASIKKGAKIHPVTSLQKSGTLFQATFGSSEIVATYRISPGPASIIVELVEPRIEGVDEIQLASLPLVPLKTTGSVLVARSDENTTVCLMALAPYTHARIQTNTFIASFYSSSSQPPAKAAIIVAPTTDFLNTIQTIEREFNLPSPKLGGEWAKTSRESRSAYLFTDLNETNVDQVIQFARSGGFHYILIYSTTWASSSGSYVINTNSFREGQKGLKNAIQKCHDAGLKVGMHMLTSAVGKADPLVSPHPDARLLKDAEAELANPVDAKSPQIPAAAPLLDFPQEHTFYGTKKAGLEIQIDDEIVHYTTIGGPGTNIFLNCQRGFLGTKPAPHAKGAKILHLAEAYGAYIADVKTTLKEKVAQRVADLVNDCGFDMIYFDGGEVNSRQTDPSGMASQQLDVLARCKRELRLQGSGYNQWLWHLYSPLTCDDYASLVPKKYLDFHKIAESWNAYHANFMPADLGWCALLDDTPSYPATTPDEIEFYAVRMLALDASFSLESRFDAMKKNGRTEEILKMFSRYEQLLLKKSVPPDLLALLRTNEWHLRIDGPRPAFQQVSYLDQRVEQPSQITLTNIFEAQPLHFRFRVMPSLSDLGNPGNLFLFHPAAPLKANASHIRPRTMPGALIETVNLQAVPLPGKKAARKYLDLSGHRALAATLRVSGRSPSPSNEVPVLNLQLEATGKLFRDYYIDLNFEGEKTIIIPESTVSRMLPGLLPNPNSYAFKLAMHGFPYDQIIALNFRWMRCSTSNPVQCEIIAVEALAEHDVPLKNASLQIGPSTIPLPDLRSGDYAEFNDPPVLRIFDRQGVLLSSKHLSVPLSLAPGPNPLRIGWDGPARVKFTSILASQSTQAW